MSQWYEVKWHRTLAHPKSDYDRKVIEHGKTGAWGNNEQDAINWVIACVSNAGDWNVFVEEVSQK